MSEENGGQQVSGEPESEPPMQPPAGPPRNQGSSSVPAEDNPINNRAAAAELEQIKVGERWLIGIGIAGILVNIALGTIYYQQLTQMRRATEASVQAIDLANQTLEYNNSNFDRAMQRTIDQTISQYEGTKASIKSARAAKSAADTAKETLHVSERAYVLIEDPVFNFFSKSIALPLVNTGHIPSGELTAIVHWATFNAPSATSKVDTSMFVHKDWQHFRWDSIAPGGHQGAEYPFPLMDIDRINDGTQHTVIAGTLSYNDGFAGTPQQYGRFCFESIYHILMKKTVLGPCNPAEIIPVLEKADGYPNNEHKDDQN